MPVKRRIALAFVGGAFFIGCFVVSWLVLPFPRTCLDIDCGLSFGSGAVNVFGSGNFTWPQTAFMILGIVGGSVLVAFAALPSLRRQGFHGGERR
jgi:hypothetical protein